MTLSPLIHLRSATLRYTGLTLANPHAATVPRGITAVIGENGAGKTALRHVVESGWNFMTNDIASATGKRVKVKSIEFNDIHSLVGFTSEYYQQRFEAAMNDDVPTVAQLLGKRAQTDIWRDMAASLSLGHVIDKKINFLSSGELRKLLVANMLFALPELLILDNPYIGLDAESRLVLDSTLRQIAAKGISVMLLVSNTAEITDVADAVLPMQAMTIGAVVERDRSRGLDELRRQFERLFSFNPPACELPVRPHIIDDSDADTIVDMRHCRVAYGSHTIIDDVDWTVRRGECWALLGPNGSGKSTLLSLVNADNPQAYANDISLFGRRRGTGESIWEVKNRIAYLSPELHLYYKAGNATVLETVVAGAKEALGPFSPTTAEQLDAAKGWIRMMGLDDITDNKFSTLSYGQQRMTLLARAFVRQPQLLILDEPLHGLDMARKRRVRELIDMLVAARGTTLIYVTHYTDELPASITRVKRLSPTATGMPESR